VAGGAAGRPATDVPYDPDGTGPLGAKALVLLTEEFGASVTVTGAPTDDADVALVLVDDLTDPQRDDLLRWVRSGGRLIVADPASPLTPHVGSSGGVPFGETAEPIEAGSCTIDALVDARALLLTSWADYTVPEEASSCFGDGREAFVVAQAIGRGVQVSIGSPDVFTNRRLGDGDNAVLAVDLLAPTDGTTLSWIERDDPEGGDGSLWSLVSPPVRAAVLQLVVASAFYVAARARRLGRPLREPQPVELAGSELVAAVGHLLHETHDPDRAARILRADLCRSLADRLGLSAHAAPQLVVDAVVARAAVDPETARLAVLDTPVPTEEALLRVTRAIESIRQEVLHDRAPQPVP
jgi:hypothetical protein